VSVQEDAPLPPGYFWCGNCGQIQGRGLETSTVWKDGKRVDCCNLDCAMSLIAERLPDADAPLVIE
jgi:hypothetical protein